MATTKTTGFISLERLALIIILVAGYWLRFQNTGDIEFNIDQIYPVWQALNTLETGEFPLAGQGTSVLFANPTLTGYIFLPFLLLSRIPLMAYLVTLSLNSFAIWMAYRGVRHLLGTRPALIAAALFAANPWIIEDSRRTWVQSLMPFFICLIFMMLVPVLTGKTSHPRRRLLVALIAVSIFANTYLLAYFITLPVGVLILIFWQRTPRRPLIIGAVFFTLLFGLYAAGLVAEWENTQNSTEAFMEGESRFTDESLTHAVRLVTGGDYAAARGVEAPADDAEQRHNISRILSAIWTVALIAGAGKSLITLRQKGIARDTAVILLLWFIIPVVMMSYVSRSVHPFYLLFTIPAGHALAARGILMPFSLPYLKNTPRPALVGSIGLLLMVTGLVNGLNAIRFAKETHHHPAAHLPYTFPLREAMQTGAYINTHYKTDTLFVTPTDIWTPMAMSGQIMPVEQSLIIDDTRIQTVSRSIQISRHGHLRMVINYAEGPRNRPVVGTPRGEPLILRDGTEISLWNINQTQINPQHVTNIPSEEEISFIGYDILDTLSPGQLIRINTYWRIEQVFPERGIWNYAPYLHLYEVTPGLQTGGLVLPAQENMLQIVDGMVFPALSWQPGDILVQQLTLEIPANSNGPYRVLTGLYDSVRSDNVIFYYPVNGENLFTPDIQLVE